MTNQEIEYIKLNLNYLKDNYDIFINQEDFIHDIDEASMITNSAILNVNYQNVYKKYLQVVSKEAYSKNFSMQVFDEPVILHEKKCFNILAVYEIMMVLLLKSSIFEGYNDLPVAEIIYAGMKKEKYIEQITPALYKMSNYDELIYKKHNLKLGNMIDELFIRMHDYELYYDKEEGLKRIATIYYYIVKNTSLFKKLTLRKKMNEFLDYLSAKLNTTPKKLRLELTVIALAQGNYSRGVTDILNIVNDKMNFIFIRNKAEEKSEEIEENIEGFKKMFMNNEKLNFNFYELTDTQKDDSKTTFDQLEGGNENG